MRDVDGYNLVVLERGTHQDVLVVDGYLLPEKDASEPLEETGHGYVQL